MEADKIAQRLYGREIVTLGTLLDLASDWTSGNLSTALIICTGFPASSDLDSFSSRLRRPLSGKGSFNGFLSKNRGVDISSEYVDWTTVEWASAAPSQRLMALVLLVGSRNLDVSGMRQFHDSLLLAAASARPIALGWTRSSDLASDVSADGISLKVFRHGSSFTLDAWNVMDELAQIAGVKSDEPSVRIMAASGALAAGVSFDPLEGVAAIAWIVLSLAAPEFDQVRFGRLRQTPGPAGKVIGWIGDLYMVTQVSRVGGFEVSPMLISSLTAAWPGSTYNGFALALSIAHGIDVPSSGPSDTNARALTEIGEDAIEAWFETLPEDLARVRKRDFLDAAATLN